MWLNLEAGCARALRTRHKITIEPPPSEQPRWHGRRALVVEAAHSYFPEAMCEDLPDLAQAEIDAGLHGSLREQIAHADPRGAQVAALRDQLVAQLGGSSDCTGALRLLDHVYLGRLVRGIVPPIITASCIAWYGYWRSSNKGPLLDTADTLQSFVEAWIGAPDHRDEVDRRIVDVAVAVVGTDAPDLVDAVV